MNTATNDERQAVRDISVDATFLPFRREFEAMDDTMGFKFKFPEIRDREGDEITEARINREIKAWQAKVDFNDVDECIASDDEARAACNAAMKSCQSSAIGAVMGAIQINMATRLAYRDLELDLRDLPSDGAAAWAALAAWKIGRGVAA